MKLVVAGTVAFLLALIFNQVETAVVAETSEHPVIPHWLDQRYLFLAAWGFPVLAVWGFNARWLPVFLGLREPSSRGLLAAGSVGVRSRRGAFGTSPSIDGAPFDRQHDCNCLPECICPTNEALQNSGGLP